MPTASWYHPSTNCQQSAAERPVWARGRCRISPPRFLAECCKRQLNQVSFVVLYFTLSTFFLICIEFVYLYFPVLFCLSVSVKWLAVKTASEMTYTVSSGALNSTPSVHGSRAFAVAAPHIWNTLPTDVVAASSLSTFRRLLKRFLFKRPYPDIIYWHHPASGPCGGCTT